MLQLVLVFCLYLLSRSGEAGASNSCGAANAHTFCQLVESSIPDRISYPSSAVYNESLASYYSGQESQLHPGCIFSPTNAAEVSRFVKLISRNYGLLCSSSPPPQFAIRSGGHTIWTGAANIEGGITIDMRSMDSLVLSEDRKVATLGVGGIWSDIYQQLDPYNLTVMGGRVAGIGVGGLATGGGINYLSRRHGWVCDNIYSYEIVLASGDIIHATAASYSDLWLALKGGSNNFGIVTSIEVPTWPLGQMWGGGISFNYTNEVLDAQALAFSNFMDPKNFDDAADMGMALVFQNPGPVYAVGNSLFYVEPIENPPVYRPFTSIPNSVGSSLRLTNTSTLSKEAGGTLPPGITRAIDIVYSFRNGDAALYSSLFQSWEDGTKALLGVEGLQLVLLIQPHPVTNGTNSLGLPVGDKDLVMSVLTAAYAQEADDELVQRGMQAIVDKHNAITQRSGLYIPFQYLNYADKSQDPISSYGADVKARLQAVSRKYDPRGVFQKGVPGGFKLF